MPGSTIDAVVNFVNDGQGGVIERMDTVSTESTYGVKITSMKLFSRFRLRLPLFSCCHWSDLDLTAQVIDPSDQALDHLVAVAASKVPCTDVFVLGPVFEHVVSGGEHGGGNGENGFLGTTTC